ncbi:hypothetical protein K9L05_00745 [Candidatus Babeliales bacterium]|nr:hypothetical protein [Candidatus Babeliales bacterium]
MGIKKIIIFFSVFAFFANNINYVQAKTLSSPATQKQKIRAGIKKKVATKREKQDKIKKPGFFAKIKNKFSDWYKTRKETASAYKKLKSRAAQKKADEKAQEKALTGVSQLFKKEEGIAAGIKKKEERAYRRKTADKDEKESLAGASQLFTHEERVAQRKESEKAQEKALPNAAKLFRKEERAARKKEAEKALEDTFVKITPEEQKAAAFSATLSKTAEIKPTLGERIKMGAMNLAGKIAEKTKSAGQAIKKFFSKKPKTKESTAVEQTLPGVVLEPEHTSVPHEVRKAKWEATPSGTTAPKKPLPPIPAEK